MSETSGRVSLDLGKEFPQCRANRVLVVDDDASVVQVIAKTLNELGYESVQCSQAQEALLFVQTQKFNLILTDYRMPEMTGLDLISQLRQDECKIPVIVMTGYLATAERIIPEKFGVFAILQKPFTMQLLAQTIEKCMETLAK